jgi:single-strand DNA-binding protein
MMTVNKVILVGNLGRDPEVKTTRSGTQVCRLSIATSERQKDGDQWVDHTEWHRVVCFGRTADNVGRYLRKGSQAYIEGKLRTSSWETDSGEKRYSTEVIADRVAFIGSKGDSSRASSGGRDSGGRGDNRGNGGGGYRQRPADDDIPF